MKSPEATQGTSGGTKLGYTDLHTSVPCKYAAKLKSGPSAERVSGGAVAAFVDGELSLPYEWADAAIVVAAKDRVVMAARGGRPAIAFEVVSPGEDSMGVLQVCPVVVKG